MTRPLSRTRLLLMAAVFTVPSLAVGVLPAVAAPVAATSANAAPATVPALQQWSGGAGSLTLTDASRVVTAPWSSTKLRQLAAQMVEDAAEVTDLRLTTASTSTPAAGDIVLRIDPAADFGSAKPELKPEAYRIEVTSARVTIVAASEKGAYYGTRSLLQAVRASSTGTTVPVGTAIDYPNYAVRGYMIDVGRRYMTPELIRSYIKWMGWQKFNTLQLHLNDNEISPPNGDWSQAQSAFRLASTNPAFHGLAATDGSYTRADWDSFEDDAAAAGVTLIPEIDAPAHARAFVKFKPELGLKDGNSDHLDLSKPATTEFMKSVYSEFAPWFRGPALHIGADEYPQKHVDQYKTYINTIAPHVRGLGKQVNIWGSFTQMSGGGAGYDKDMTVNSWNNGWYGPKAAIADGYKVINSNDGHLYTVPYAGYYASLGLSGKSIFNNWEPHVFGGDQNLTPQDPNLLGAMPAVWNDAVRLQYTELQMHGLLEKSMAALAQKMWSGSKADTDYETFLNRVRTAGQGPGTAYLPDTLGNNIPGPDLAHGRTASASSTETSAFPASKAVDHKPATRWSSKYTNDQWVQVDLGSSKRVGSISLDWEAAYGKDYDIQVSDDGTTWRTVAERRGLAKAGIDRLVFAETDARFVRMQGIARGTRFGYSITAFEVHAPLDLAAGRTHSASSYERDRLRPELALDNNPATRWSSNYTDGEWLSIDFGSQKQITGVRLDWEAAYGKDYDIQVSDDGTTWRTIAERRGENGGTDDIAFAATTARYVKMQGITRGTVYGYSLHTFHVRG
ncbi:discoidin domain-containing protein [Streptomyces sp. NPDC056501]|uniref:discoidin domain-containing protein n=1 Tax=Streptomyces sp. NPDC056501 TaxID=3345841 RepID=UPI0036AF2823